MVELLLSPTLPSLTRRMYYVGHQTFEEMAPLPMVERDSILNDLGHGIVFAGA